jgi:hypothetical protein
MTAEAIREFIGRLTWKGGNKFNFTPEAGEAFGVELEKESDVTQFRLMALARARVRLCILPNGASEWTFQSYLVESAESFKFRS